MIRRDKLEGGGKQERNGGRAKEAGRPGKHGGSLRIVDNSDVLPHTVTAPNQVLCL